MWILTKPRKKSRIMLAPDAVAIRPLAHPASPYLTAESILRTSLSSSDNDRITFECREGYMSATTASVRYMIDDVDVAIAFYTTHLGFTLESNAAPAFAAVIRGPLRLLLSGKTSSGARAMPDGRQPVPGGWNRIQLPV